MNPIRILLYCIYVFIFLYFIFPIVLTLSVIEIWNAEPRIPELWMLNEPIRIMFFTLAGVGYYFWTKTFINILKARKKSKEMRRDER